MRKIFVEEICSCVKKLCIKACTTLPSYTITKIKEAKKTYSSDQQAITLLEQLIENNKIAQKYKFPLCQDTGMVIVFLDIGEKVKIYGDEIEKKITLAVGKAYKESGFRPSIVKDVIYERKNTFDNTPIILHLSFIKGEKLRITVMPKGFGSENVSKTAMLLPTGGEKAIEEFVIDTVREAGGKPCPPIFVGIGIGGTLDKAVLLAKKALIPFYHKNRPKKIVMLEDRLLKKINQLNIGIMGYRCGPTAFDCKILEYPTHIAGLPVAINISCHSLRFASCTI